LDIKTRGYQKPRCLGDVDLLTNNEDCLDTAHNLTIFKLNEDILQESHMAENFKISEVKLTK